MRELIPGLDVLLDLHAGGALPTVDYAYIDNDEALSASLGTKILYRGPAKTIADAPDPIVRQFVRGELEGPLTE